MRRFWNGLRDFFRRGDLFLLLLCIIISVYGIVMITSATRYASDSPTPPMAQIIALLIGVALYIMISLVDIKILAEHHLLLLVFNTLIMLLLVPLGQSINGNRAWLKLPGIPFTIQPAEICKITFVIILAKTLNTNKAHLSSPKSVSRVAAETVYMVFLVRALSNDDGSALVFLFIFAIVAYTSGIRGWWFLLGAILLAAALPLIWRYVLAPYQRERILVPYHPEIDPKGIGVRRDMNLSLAMLSGGGVSGQGLFHGSLTGVRRLSAQATDFIFSVIGEELGLLGCLGAVLLEVAIIVRILLVGLKTPNFMNRTVCFGLGAMMVFQVLTNIGMCLGLFPVIGLTLPFLSSGGSSLITMFLAMGLVSGIHMRPDPESKSPYIQPKL